MKTVKTMLATICIIVGGLLILYVLIGDPVMIFINKGNALPLVALACGVIWLVYKIVSFNKNNKGEN